MKIINNQWYINSGGNEVFSTQKGDNFIMKGDLLEYIVNSEGKYTYEGNFPHPYDVEETIQKKLNSSNLYIMCICFDSVITQKICEQIPTENEILSYLYQEYNLDDLTVQYKTDICYILNNNITVNFYENKVIHWITDPNSH